MRYSELEYQSEKDFIQRHIGPSDSDVAEMLEIVVFDSLDQTTRAILPKSIQMTEEMAVCRR